MKGKYRNYGAGGFSASTKRRISNQISGAEFNRYEVLGFGKFHDTMWRDVPQYYLKWLVETNSPYAASKARSEMFARDIER